MSQLPIWRLIIDGPLPPPMNMGLDEAIMMSVGEGSSPPTIRFYAWATPALSIGYSQVLGRTVDLEACHARGVVVVRRLTGGRAVLHDEEITYSIMAPEDLLPTGIKATYQWVAEGLVAGLKRLSLKAELSCPSSGNTRRALHCKGACYDAPSWCEITVGGRKLVGSAQVRRQGAVLQHGSIPLIFRAEDTASLLLPADPDTRSRIARDLERRAAGLADFLRPLPERESIIETLADCFSRVHGLSLQYGCPTMRELAMAEHLTGSRYASWDWTCRR